MAAPFYSLLITAVGQYVESYLRDQKLILFSDAITGELAHYCALHQSSDRFENKTLSPGQHIKINNAVYPVTAVGSVATDNLKQLGHITLNFDAADEPELPGSIHLAGNAPRDITIGDRISFHDVLN